MYAKKIVCLTFPSSSWSPETEDLSGGTILRLFGDLKSPGESFSPIIWIAFTVNPVEEDGVTGISTEELGITVSEVSMTIDADVVETEAWLADIVGAILLDAVKDVFDCLVMFWADIAVQANVVSSGVSIRLCGNGRKGLNGLAATFSSTGNSPTMGRACIGLPDSSSS